MTPPPDYAEPVRAAGVWQKYFVGEQRVRVGASPDSRQPSRLAPLVRLVFQNFAAQRPRPILHWNLREMLRDEEFRAFLNESKIVWTLLDQASAFEAEREWRRIYGQAFSRPTRAREGAKAEHAFRQQDCDHFLVVPFTSGVAGLPVNSTGRSLAAYECRGALADLSVFHSEEFFITPLDFAWTMVHTHEDHGFGGPYFHRKEWVRQ